MKNDLFQRRFEELAGQYRNVEATKRVGGQGLEIVDDELLLNWKMKVKTLLLKVCGEGSGYPSTFDELERPRLMGQTNLDILKQLGSVFDAAREDYEGGYLASLKSLVQAEVFDDELEQAEELFRHGYLTAAAVIAGVVLETGIRELCSRAQFDFGKLDKMNADLAKAGAYNKLTQKKVIALANIRNSAAHGKPDEFSKEDVENMIRDVRSFLENQL